MTLIKSISGIRGTIGGKPGTNLTAIDAVEFGAAFAEWLKTSSPNPKVVVGRDGRMSGLALKNIIISTLQFSGVDVIDADLSTTPAIEMAVPRFKADGGIILTASHNPKEWNALKFLNSKGEFISAEDGQDIIDIIDARDFNFVEVDDLGTVTSYTNSMEDHAQEVIANRFMRVDDIKTHGFKVLVDGINSTGSLAIPVLLQALNVDYDLINGDVTGNFAHNPEPKAEHLAEITNLIQDGNYDMGIVVDPDVDRLAFVCEDGTLFGEEFTLVAAADYILDMEPSDTVSNLSSTRALRDVTQKYGKAHHASAVGEVNVVNKMKEVNALIGGEGNGGVILPSLHYGRDAIAGIGLILSLLATRKTTLSELKKFYPAYAMSKDKVQLEDIDTDGVLNRIKEKYAHEKVSDIDGVKIDFERGWVHMRKSNTEPIIRVYSEATSESEARALTEKFKSEIVNA